MSTKVLVTGSRDFKDYQIVYDALDEIYADGLPMIVIHGAARGADSFADTWAVHRKNVTVVRVPADWDNDGWGAGPRRNDAMLELGPRVVLAFFQEGAANKGTTHMATACRNAGLEVRTYRGA